MSKVILDSPENAQTGVSPGGPLVWNAAPGWDRYRLEVAERDPLLEVGEEFEENEVLINRFITDAVPVDGKISFVADPPLSNQTEYVWRVRAARIESVLSLTVSPSTATVEPGNTVQFAASFETIGNPSTAVTWESSNEAVMTVDENGLGTAHGSDSQSATITAISVFDETKMGTAVVTIGEVSITGLTITPQNPSGAIGNQVQYTAQVTATGGADTSVTWSSLNENIATIDSNGLATRTGVGFGEDIIRAVSVFNPSVEGFASITSTAAPSEGTVEGDRDGLMAFADSTDMQGWINKSGWGGAASTINDWYGINTNSNGRVVSVNLLSNNLAGSLSNGLSNLKFCELLNVKNNFLTGGLDAEIGQMTRLKYLWLAGGTNNVPFSTNNDYHPGKSSPETNSFDGATLPPEWSDLSDIRHIQLSQTQVTGPIPASWGSMVTLERLMLDGARKDGAYPGGLIQGPLPPELGNCSNLMQLTLNYNYGLESTLPPEWGNWKQMRQLRLTDMRLYGTIPPEWEGMASTLRLWVMDSSTHPDKMTGEIPAWIFDDRSPILNTAIFKFMNFTSIEQPNVNNITKETIGVLGFDYNHITAPFPNFVKRFRRLTNFQIPSGGSYNNQFTGPMDDDFFDNEFATMDRTRTFLLSGQPIGGTLPSSFGTARSTSSTQNLGFNGCGFGGKIPESWGDYRSDGLHHLYLNSNDLYGQIPVGIADWREAREKDVTVNASTNTINHSNSYSNGQVIYVEASTMPGNLLSNTRYYIINWTSSNYQLSTTPGGSAVNITSTGSNVKVRRTSWFRTSSNGLRLHTNRFTYSDLIPLINAWHSGAPLEYHNQKDFPVDDYINPNQSGSTITLDLSGIDVAGNVYQWRRNGNNISNGSGIAGATSHTLELSGAGVVAGQYTLRITNSNAPDLTESISQPITVTT